MEKQQEIHEHNLAVANIENIDMQKSLGLLKGKVSA